MNYLPLPDEAARQLIDSQTIFTELQRVRAQAAPLSGGMYWKKEGGYEYLVKTSARNRQTRVLSLCAPQAICSQRAQSLWVNSL